MKEPKTVEEIIALRDVLRLFAPGTEVKYFAEDEHTGPAYLNAVFFPCADSDGNVIDEADAGILLLWEKETKWRAYIYGSGKRYPMNHASNTLESALRMGLGTHLFSQDNEAKALAKGSKETT